MEVFGAQDLDQPAYTDVFELINRLPNVVLTENSTLPAIRGLDGNGVAQGGAGAVSGGRPRLTTFVDGVSRSYAFARNAMPQTWDIQQLEVYRGSQATIFGRNSSAGAIVVKTNSPVYEFEGAAQVGIRSADTRYSAAAVVNFPLIDDKFAARISLEGWEGDNWLDFTGPELGPVADDLKELSQRRVRARLLWEPTGTDGPTFMLSYERN